jgi:hypothetical protein
MPPTGCHYHGNTAVEIIVWCDPVVPYLHAHADVEKLFFRPKKDPMHNKDPTIQVDKMMGSP